eukprot:5978206-Amphidinium_carterae.1
MHKRNKSILTLPWQFGSFVTLTSFFRSCHRVPHWINASSLNDVRVSCAAASLAQTPPTQPTMSDPPSECGGIAPSLPDTQVSWPHSAGATDGLVQSLERQP